MAATALQSLSYENALRQVWRDTLSSNQATQSWLTDLCMSTTTNQPQGETYGLLQAIGGFQKWQGPVTADSLTMWNKSVKPDSYHNSVFVPRLEWSFDHFNVIKPQVQEMGQSAENFKFKLVSDRINNGASEAGIDGANFFSTTHSWNGGANQSNLVSTNLNDLPANVRGTSTNPSAEEAGRLMMKGARTIIGFKNTRNEAQIVPSARFLVMVPMKYVEPFAEAIGQTTYSYGVGNPIATLSQANLNLTFSVVANPLLNDAGSGPFETSIAMFRVDAPMKPLILQELSPLNLNILAEGTEHWVKNNNALVMATWEGASANWMWTSALKLTMTRS
jgi:hypothetical protein